MVPMPSYMDELINQIKKKRDAKSGTAQGRDFDKPQMVKTTPVAPKPEEKPVQKPPENREDIKSAMKRELEMLKANVKKPEQKPVEKAGSHEGNAEGEMRRESPPKQDLGAAKGAVIPKEAAGKKLSLEEMVSQAGDSEEIHEKSEFEKEMEKANKELIESYGDAKIFRVKDDPLPYYWVPVARPAGSEKTIISTIKEVATRIVSITPYKISDPEQRKSVYKQKILEILSESPELNIPKTRHEFYADAVVREMVGYGIIDLLIKDDELEEIMVIGPMTPVYVFHRKYEMMRTNIEFYSDQEIVDLVNRIARQVGRRVDISNPLLDARLPDGSRVNATIPPASVSGSSLTIRKFKADPYSMIDMVRMGTLSIEAAAHLWACVEGLGVKPANILIAGGTGSGKTTTLNVLASFVRPYERVITIEDTAELNLPLKHLIRLEGKPPGLEGTGEITLDILTKNSLRMRPDRIIVGEVRHAEAFSLFTAMNTGHDGCLWTVHANSPDETIIRSEEH